MGALRTLGRLFIAEGELAEEEGRIDKASATHLDPIRLGQHGWRGGTLIDSLSGQAIEATGQQALDGLPTKLDAAPARRVSLVLESFDRNREGLSEVRDHERLWQARTNPMLENAWTPVSGAGLGQLRESTEAVTRAYQEAAGPAATAVRRPRPPRPPLRDGDVP